MVWKKWQNLRYFGGKPEIEVIRFKRMLDNRQIMADLGLGAVDIDKPITGYTIERWKQDLKINDDYEAALKRYKEGVEAFEEDVNYDPTDTLNSAQLTNTSERYETLDTSQTITSPIQFPHSPQSYKHRKGNIISDNSSNKNKKSKTKTQSSSQAQINTNKSQIKQEVLEDEFPSPSSGSREITGPETDSPDVTELEMLLHNNPQSEALLQDLVVFNDLTSHVISTPLNISSLLADFPDKRGHILMSVSEQFLPQDEFIEMFLQRNPEGLQKLLKACKPISRLPSKDCLVEDRSGLSYSCKKHRYCRNTEECRKNRYKSLIHAKELCNKFNKISAEEYSKGMVEILKNLERIEISDDEEEDPKTLRLKEEAVKFKKAISKKSFDKNKIANTVSNKSSSTDKNNGLEKTVKNDLTREKESQCSDTSGMVVQYEKDIAIKLCPTDDNIYMSTGSANIPVKKIITSAPKKATSSSKSSVEEIDDFDFLATLDDCYLLSLFNEKGEDKHYINIENCENDTVSEDNNIKTSQHKLDSIVGNSSNNNNKCDETTKNGPISGDVAHEDMNNDTSKVCANRVNPSRTAKIGVTYKEDNNEEEKHIDGYYCWKCEAVVTTTCELHGSLLPCTEHVTSRGTKNPDKFPTPSFVEIRVSGIPGAGMGVFATKFIKPGQIIGEYRGKKITEKDYNKLEKSHRESGYAWKTYNKDGKSLYIDGANYQNSNWLRYINCARGKCEENVMVRTSEGKIEYYTFKTVAIETELLVFYGNEYFTELGYLVEEDEPEIGGKYHCSNCYKLYNSEIELQQHVCFVRGRNTNPIKEKNFKCETCGKLFSQKQGLNNHIRFVHEKIKQFSCPYCHYRCTDNSNLTKHLATHSGVKKYKCTHCDYAAVKQYNLTVHINTHHINKTYRCKYKGCDVKKTSQEELYEHIKSDHPVQKYMCDNCPMSFSTSHNLKVHKMSHNKDSRAYQCKYCEKRFGTSANLARHYRTHTGDKPYKCEICKKKFSQVSHLNRHKLTHTGEKRFSCLTVTKSLVGATMNQHMR